MHCTIVHIRHFTQAVSVCTCSGNVVRNVTTPSMKTYLTHQQPPVKCWRMAEVFSRGRVLHRVSIKYPLGDALGDALGRRAEAEAPTAAGADGWRITEVTFSGGWTATHSYSFKSENPPKVTLARSSSFNDRHDIYIYIYIGGNKHRSTN